MLHTDNDSQNTQTTEQSASPQASSNAYAGGGLFDILGVTTTTGATSPEGLDKATEMIEQYIKNTRSGYHLMIFNDTNQLRLPVLSIAQKTPKGIDLVVILIEGLLSSPIDSIQDNVAGQNIEIDVVTAHAYDEKLDKVIRNDVASQLDVGPDNISIAGFFVVPEFADLADPKTVSVIYDTAKLALSASPNLPEAQLNALSARAFNTRDAVVIANTKTTPGSTTLDVFNRPVATDVTINLEVRNTSQNSNKIHDDSNSVVLATTNVLVDFIYAPEHQQTFQTVQSQNPVPGYHPQLVITNCSSLSLRGGKTAENLITNILGVMSVTPLATNFNWAEVFNPINGKLHGNKSSVGNLALEHNPYPGTEPKRKQIKVHSGGSGGEKDSVAYNQVIPSFCTGNVTLSMDIELGGRTNWIQSIFYAASQGNQQAIQGITAELDAFTDGEYSKRCTEPFVMPNPVTIHLGNYVPADGAELRDIREVDYLKMLENAGADTDQIMAEWGASFEPGNDHVVMIDKRRKILELLVGPSMKVTGLAARVSFNPRAVNALLEACRVSGLSIQSEGLHSQGAQLPRGSGYDPSRATNDYQTAQLFQFGGRIVQPNVRSPYAHASGYFHR